MLSCDCDYDCDYEFGDWVYWYEDSSADFEKLKTSRRKRCCSCGDLINIGSLCLIHARCRYPYNETEARIIGADPDCNEEPPIRIADHYHCEKCGEIYLNLTALEYCFSPNESMPELLKQYHELSGFKVTGK